MTLPDRKEKGLSRRNFLIGLAAGTVAFGVFTILKDGNPTDRGQLLSDDEKKERERILGLIRTGRVIDERTYNPSVESLLNRLSRVEPVEIRVNSLAKGVKIDMVRDAIEHPNLHTLRPGDALLDFGKSNLEDARSLDNTMVAALMSSEGFNYSPFDSKKYIESNNCLIQPDSWRGTGFAIPVSGVDLLLAPARWVNSFMSPDLAIPPEDLEKTLVVVRKTFNSKQPMPIEDLKGGFTIYTEYGAYPRWRDSNLLRVSDVASRRAYHITSSIQ